MSDVLVYRLMKNREAILEDLEADQVLDYLYQEDVLDGNKYDEVRDKTPRKKQAALLLSYVEKQGSAVEKMIDALERSSQRHLARILQEELPNEDTLSKGISQLLQNDEDDVYPMTHVPCGYAVIINNSQFQKNNLNLECREGSEVDVVNMSKLFHYLQFKVVVRENKTAAEIMHIVRDFTVNEDHKNFDCFVLFLMSHGFPSGIYGTDGEKVYLQRLRELLAADKCFGLANKPKLIFVQACRGRQADTGYLVTESPTLPGTTPSQNHDSYPTYTPSNLDITLYNDLPEVNVQYIPQDADMFIACASTAHHAALRNTKTGGWFVTQLYDVFYQYAETEDLQEMWRRVTYKVSLMRKERKMQCPEQIACMRKKVFFKPRKY